MKLIPYTCPDCGTSLVISPAHPVIRCKSCGVLLDLRDCFGKWDPRALDAACEKDPPAGKTAPSRSRALYEAIMAEEKPRRRTRTAPGASEKIVRKPASRDISADAARYYSAADASVRRPEPERPAEPRPAAGGTSGSAGKAAAGAAAGRKKKEASGKKAASYYTLVGFRTGTLWKSITAILGYLFLVLTAQGSVTTAVYCFTMILFWFDWAPLTDHLPFGRIGNTFLRVLAKLAFSLVWMVVLVMIAIQFDLD